MSRDVHRQPAPDRGPGRAPSGIEECARLGARLTRASHADRDLAWHVMAYYVGDLGALASARLRAPGGPSARR